MWNYRKRYEHFHAIKKNFALLQQSSLSKKEWQGRIWCTHTLLWWGKSCYILNQLSSIIRKEIVRLYHDDGLGIFKNIAGPEIEYKRKYTVNVLKNCGLKITTKTNITSTIFLDLRLKLKENTYKPYWKPNSNSIYIDKHSNHHINIIRKIPKSICKRLSEISCDRNVFEKVVYLWNCTEKSGFSDNLHYAQQKVNEN